jgi:hypothetical protein
LEVLAVEAVGTLYGHLVYFAAIWFILWLFGIFPILVSVPRKIWQPCSPILLRRSSDRKGKKRR